MTDEQNERLKQIRERRAAEDESAYSYDDIDLLLSLVAGQRPFGWISCGLRNGNDRIVDIVFENADCAKAFIDNVEPVDGPIVIADKMRSACIKKVKEFTDEWLDSPETRYGSAEAFAKALTTRLKSVTIQEQEKQP